MPAQPPSKTDDLFSGRSAEQLRQLGSWSLAALQLELERREQQIEWSDEQLRRRLTDVSGDDFDLETIAVFKRLQQLTPAQLDRLLEIRGLYQSSSPFASGRIEIYKQIARLAPWDDVCLAKISAEHEEQGQLLTACDWLERARRVNPDNASLQTKWEQLSAASAAARQRSRRRRVIRYAALGTAAVLLVWGSGYRISGNREAVLAAVARMEDTKIPDDVAPRRLIRHVFTDYERATFRNPHGGSYLVLVSSPYRKLGHTSFAAATANDPQTVATETYRFTIRGRPAEFVYRKTDRFETVHGYFQGKRYPVGVTARFEFSDRDVYAEGGAPEWIESLGGMNSDQ